jgi:hypothetical protein
VHAHLLRADNDHHEYDGANYDDGGDYSAGDGQGGDQREASTTVEPATTTLAEAERRGLVEGGVEAWWRGNRAARVDADAIVRAAAIICANRQG